MDYHVRQDEGRRLQWRSHCSVENTEESKRFANSRCRCGSTELCITAWATCWWTSSTSTTPISKFSSSFISIPTSGSILQYICDDFSRNRGHCVGAFDSYQWLGRWNKTRKWCSRMVANQLLRTLWLCDNATSTESVDWILGHHSQWWTYTNRSMPESRLHKRYGCGCSIPAGKVKLLDQGCDHRRNSRQYPQDQKRFTIRLVLTCESIKKCSANGNQSSIWRLWNGLRWYSTQSFPSCYSSCTLLWCLQRRNFFFAGFRAWTRGSISVRTRISCQLEVRPA